MKKLLITLTCLFVLLSFTACDSNTQTSSPESSDSTSAADQPTSPSDSTQSDSSANEVKILESIEKPDPTENGDIDDYTISILDGVQDVDSDGNPILIVGYEYTNNSDETASLIDVLYPRAMQDTSMLKMATISDSSKPTTEFNVQEAEPGETITVYVTYNLVSTSPVTVLVTGLSYDGDTNITKTFDLE